MRRWSIRCASLQGSPMPTGPRNARRRTSPARSLQERTKRAPSPARWHRSGWLAEGAKPSPRLRDPRGTRAFSPRVHVAVSLLHSRPRRWRTSLFGAVARAAEWAVVRCMVPTGLRVFFLTGALPWVVDVASLLKSGGGLGRPPGGWLGRLGQAPLSAAVATDCALHAVDWLRHRNRCTPSRGGDTQRFVG